MKRPLLLVLGGFAVFGAYVAVIYGVAPDASVGPVTFAGILIPGLVSGLVMMAYVTLETRNLKEATERAEELSAQLVRKEIEIGRLATVDELTGLYTRREFDDAIRLEFERGRRHGRDLTLLILEIDDIAELGEHVGKLSKGYLVSEVSAILRSMLRVIDIGCRYSPDNMALLLPETSGAQALVVADKIRAAIAAHEFLGQFGGEAMHVTVSQGLAAAVAGIATHTELMRAAEQALYDARAAGFDQVRLAEPGDDDDASADVRAAS